MKVPAAGPLAPACGLLCFADAAAPPRWWPEDGAEDDALACEGFLALERPWRVMSSPTSGKGGGCTACELQSREVFPSLSRPLSHGCLRPPPAVVPWHTRTHTHTHTHTHRFRRTVCSLGLELGLKGLDFFLGALAPAGVPRGLDVGRPLLAARHGHCWESSGKRARLRKRRKKEPTE